MAIQMRRGAYSNFDSAKLLPGELAVVTSGDPNSDTGRAIYVCFETGVVKRFTTYEDFETELDSAMAELKESFSSDMTAATAAANNAASSATTATEKANEATTRANAAAAACEGIADNTRITALEEQMERVIATLANVLGTGTETES